MKTFMTRQPMPGFLLKNVCIRLYGNILVNRHSDIYRTSFINFFYLAYLPNLNLTQ